MKGKQRDWKNRLSIEKKKNETAEQKVERLKKLSARRKQKLRDETAIQKLAV